MPAEIPLARFYAKAALLTRLLFRFIAFLPNEILVIEFLLENFQSLIPLPKYFLNLNDTFLQVFIDILLSLDSFRQTRSDFFG